MRIFNAFCVSDSVPFSRLTHLIFPLRKKGQRKEEKKKGKMCNKELEVLEGKGEVSLAFLFRVIAENQTISKSQNRNYLSVLVSCVSVKTRFPKLSFLTNVDAEFHDINDSSRTRGDR